MSRDNINCNLFTTQIERWLPYDNVIVVQDTTGDGIASNLNSTLVKYDRNTYDAMLHGIL